MEFSQVNDTGNERDMDKKSEKIAFKTFSNINYSIKTILDSLIIQF